MAFPSVHFYFLFLLLTIWRTSLEQDSVSGIPGSRIEDKLVKEGIKLITTNRGLRSFSTFPNIRRAKMHTSLYLSLILITCASDVELNPGPRTPKYPCQICHKAVTMKQQGVACDDCNLWYHAKCMHMTTTVYNCLNNVSWHCVACGMPQFTSSFFDSIDIHTNSFSSLDSSGLADAIGPPKACSSPKAANTNSGTSVTLSRGTTLWFLISTFRASRTRRQNCSTL